MRRASLLATLALFACKNDITVNDRPNTPPAAVINSPTDGSAVNAGQNIEFVGVVADQNGLDDITNVTWSSSVDGELGSADIAIPDAEGVTRVATILSEGVHAITLRVVDAAGESGEETISVSVGALQQEPIVAISSPEVFQTFFIGANVDLVGAASDTQDPAESLTVEWTAEISGSNAPMQIWTGTPDASGIVTGSWVAEQGNWILTLRATDTDGFSGEEQVAIQVTNSDGADLDGDGFSPLNGDCDDTDASIHPNAHEVCGDALDNDCNGDVDDKDEDNDDHVDAACVNYTGALPIDDCNDDDSFIFPGAGELQDGEDNDCDGFIDEDTPAFDDDGDCYCEVGPCEGSTNPSCATIDEGDCDDDNAALNPAGTDVPDTNYDDGNCDGIDGDIGSMVFVDTLGGSNANDGLTPTTAVADLNRAYDVASASGRRQIALSPGNAGLTGPLREGVSLYGGYAPSNGWTRDVNALPLLSTDNNGWTLSNWTVDTEFQQIELRAGNTSSPSGSSIALTILDSDNLTIASSLVRSGTSGDGTDGGSGGIGSPGATGGNGGVSDTENSGFLGVCGGPNPRPTAGTGGTTNGVTTGGMGGQGGSNSNSPAQEQGDDGIGPGGGGGPAATTDDGSAGEPGLQGTDGAAGSPGFEVGNFSSGGYAAADGGPGGSGGDGGGGGGGGGADGGENDITCDTWGGSGGGGGGGGVGGTGGTGGTGAGASTAILLVGSSVTIIGSTLQTGSGGNGGNGGNGGVGGGGGNGGSGGGGGDPLLFESAGKGGDGGQGGQGGRGGHGGGGGGGPSIGVVCISGGNLTQTDVNFNIGNGGTGGGGPGSPGESGRSVETDGC